MDITTLSVEAIQKLDLPQAIKLAKSIGLAKIGDYKRSQLVEEILLILTPYLEEKQKIEEAEYNELVSIASKKNLKFIGLKRPELRAALLATILPIKEKSTSTKTKVVKELRADTKSAQMIELFKSGELTMWGIAKLMDTHYSFVYGVIKRWEKRQQQIALLEANGQPTEISTNVDAPATITMEI